MWQNTYAGSKWSFVDRGIVSTGTMCTQSYGVIENDLGVQFADLTGDKRLTTSALKPTGILPGISTEA